MRTLPRARTRLRGAALLALAAAASSAPLALLACREEPRPVDPARYRLTHEGRSWRRVGDDHVFRDLKRRYPDFFAVILDAGSSEEPDILPLRRDLEDPTAGRARYDALNAVAIGYFELNARAQEALRGDGGSSYLGDSFRATKLLSIPWRAYAEIEDPALRGAILAFYEDIGQARKRGTRRTAHRILRLVLSLEKKERDPERLARIRALSERLAGLRRELEVEMERAEAANRAPVRRMPVRR